MTDLLLSPHPVVQSAVILAAFGLGWWAGRRAPDGVDYGFWLKVKRRWRRASR